MNYEFNSHFDAAAQGAHTSLQARLGCSVCGPRVHVSAPCTVRPLTHQEAPGNQTPPLHSAARGEKERERGRERTLMHLTAKSLTVNRPCRGQRCSQCSVVYQEPAQMTSVGTDMPPFS